MPAMDDVPDYEKIGRFIYGMHRAGLGEEELQTLAADTAHPERAACAARLLQLFARIRSAGDHATLARDCDDALEDALRLRGA